MTSRILPRLLIVAIISIIAVAGLAACAGDDADEELDADELLENAADRFEELESVAFELELDAGIALDRDGALLLRSAGGELARPDSASAAVGVSVAGATVSIELIVVEGDVYVQNIATGNWEEAPVDFQYDPSAIFDAQSGVANLITRLEEPGVDGSESIDGVDTSRVNGTLDTDQVVQLTGDVFDTDTLDVTLWIDREDHDIHRIRLQEAGGEAWILNLSDHNEPVEISRPDVD